MNCNYHHKNELALAWLNLSYVSAGLFNRKTKPILVKLNGQINYHTLTALMGPSGAGKTTLLKCINMRNKEGLTTDSKMFVNKYCSLRTCFIMQDSSEHLFMGLTVRESLLFASKIKNVSATKLQYRDSYAQTGNSLLCLDNTNENQCEVSTNDFEPIDQNGNFDHNTNVEKILSELLLEDCASNSVNDCSGGEQKRLSIGLELVAQLKPNLLCIDEPTSGLDSNAAELVIQCLSQLAERHQMAIVTSIHQPNSLLLNMFDQLYVLSKGGHCVFNGRPQILRQYLNSNSITCAEDVLPIELLLKISSKYPKNRYHFNENNNEVITENNDNSLTLEIESDENRGLVNKNNEIDRLIESAYKNSANISDECKLYGKLVTKRVNKETQYFNFYHFYYLLLRGFACFVRYQWKVSAALAMFAIMVSFLLIYLYGTDIGEESGCLDLNPTDPLLVNNTFGTAMKLLNQDSKVMLNLKCQFFVIAFLQFISLSCAILVFPQEVRIFLNEHQNKWYSTSSYFWSKFILEIPSTVFIGYLYAFIMYYGTGQLSETFRFSFYSLTTVFGMFVANSIGAFIGIIFVYNFQVAVTSGIACFLVMVLLCGFFVPLSTQHIIIRGMSFSSIVKLTFESIMITIYGLDRCEPNTKPILLHQLDLEDDSLLSTNAWIILGHSIIWRLVAMFALSIRANSYSLVTFFRSKPKLKASDENKNLSLVANYLKN